MAVNNYNRLKARIGMLNKSLTKTEQDRAFGDLLKYMDKNCRILVKDTSEK